MKDNWKYVLFEYDYISYYQGTADRGHTFALVHCPEDCSFANARSVLINAKHRENYHEIDIKSVEDMTIEW